MLRLHLRSSVVAVGCWTLLCGSAALAQAPSHWPCMDEVGGGATRISSGVSGRLVQNKFLPDISDIKERKLDSIVVVRVVVDIKGSVRCGRGEQGGDPDLFPRSVAAAEKWRFKPLLLSGEPAAFETEIQFRYKKHKVEVFVPDR